MDALTWGSYDAEGLNHCGASSTMLQRCILVLAATIFASAGYAAETQRAASAELGFYNSQSLEDCMAIWDPLTHMTKAQWRTTCDRIRAERLPYLEEMQAD
jgi:hypothetical protein